MLNVYIGKEERSKTNYLISPLRDPGKEQIKAKTSRRKEIIILKYSMNQQN